MVMNFNMPPKSGVHHDEAPPAIRMTIAERLAAKMAERGMVDVVDESANTAADDAVAELVKSVNEKRSVEATPVSEAVVEAPKDAVVEKTVEKTVEEIAAEDKSLREKAMVKAAEKRRAAIGTQRSLVDVRTTLRLVPNAMPMAAKMERPPMPKIDPFLTIEIPGFGEAQILSIDEDAQTMYFATPEERRNVDVLLSKDEGMGSMKAANFENVIAITPDQARQYIATAEAKRRFAPAETAESAPVKPANIASRMDRYRLAA